MNERLQRLRVALKMEWGELATHLELSRSMLDFVRKGERNLSFPAIRRLEEAERAAGIAPPAPPVPASVPAPNPPRNQPNGKLENSGSGGKRTAELRRAIKLIRDGLDLLERNLDD